MITKPLEKKYEWIRGIGQLPKILEEALKWYGTLEKPGPQSNNTILDWAKRVGVAGDYTTDSIAWCGLFIAICVLNAGYMVVPHPLWARNWMKYGIRVDVPMLGDIIVFQRDLGGHVAIVIAEDEGGYLVYGGNQSDQVCFTWIAKTRVLGAFRTPYHVTPPSVKRYFVNRKGELLSTNEA